MSRHTRDNGNVHCVSGICRCERTGSTRWRKGKNTERKTKKEKKDTVRIAHKEMKERAFTSRRRKVDSRRGRKKRRRRDAAKYSIKQLKRDSLKSRGNALLQSKQATQVPCRSSMLIRCPSLALVKNGRTHRTERVVFTVLTSKCLLTDWLC